MSDVNRIERAGSGDDALLNDRAPRLRLGEADGIYVDIEVACDLRDALYDDASFQSSSEACDIVQRLLEDAEGSQEQEVSTAVAADLARGIDHLSGLYELPPALIELRTYLRRSSHPRSPAEEPVFEGSAAPEHRLSAVQDGH